LQKQILSRERQLGMSPVLCAFVGHVPEALKAKQPDMKIERSPSRWNGFSLDCGCWVLNPLDPRFKEIQIRFLKEQAKEYGVSHYLGADPFNEIKPLSWDASYLADTARAIYSGMTAVDPQAVWLQMTWTFSMKPWKSENRLETMIKAVPQGHMVLLDYVCEGGEMFRNAYATNFFGAPFIWNYLGNFGGRNNLFDPMSKINDRITTVMNDAALTNCIGVGSTLEGFNNPVAYELVFDRVWQGVRLDMAEWIRETARARAGGGDVAVEAAWEMMRTNVLTDANHLGRGTVVYQSPDIALRPGPFISQGTLPLCDLFAIWEQFLTAGPVARSRSAYERDLAEITRQSLANLGAEICGRMVSAFDQKDRPAFEKAAAEFMTVGRDLDAFLACRTEYSLGKWIASAKSWAANETEKLYYERNARLILTTWGEPDAGGVHDYAYRHWNGLLRDYYLPRWQLTIDARLASLKDGKPIVMKALRKQWKEQAWKFVDSTEGVYPATPQGDVFSMSRSLHDKYAKRTAPQ